MRMGLFKNYNERYNCTRNCVVVATFPIRIIDCHNFNNHVRWYDTMIRIWSNDRMDGWTNGRQNNTALCSLINCSGNGVFDFKDSIELYIPYAMLTSVWYFFLNLLFRKWMNVSSFQCRADRVIQFDSIVYQSVIMNDFFFSLRCVTCYLPFYIVKLWISSFRIDSDLTADGDVQRLQLPWSMAVTLSQISSMVMQTLSLRCPSHVALFRPHFHFPFWLSPFKRNFLEEKKLSWKIKSYVIYISNLFVVSYLFSSNSSSFSKNIKIKRQSRFIIFLKFS